MDFSPHSMAPLGAASSSQPCSALSPGTGALILQKGEVRVINQTTCEELMPQQITPRMMCVGFLAGGVDACQVCERPEEWRGTHARLSPLRATPGARCPAWRQMVESSRQVW
jgi:hypothetical protein